MTEELNWVSSNGRGGIVCNRCLENWSIIWKSDVTEEPWPLAKPLHLTNHYSYRLLTNKVPSNQIICSYGIYWARVAYWHGSFEYTWWARVAFDNLSKQLTTVVLLVNHLMRRAAELELNHMLELRSEQELCGVINYWSRTRFKGEHLSTFLLLPL